MHGAGHVAALTGSGKPRRRLAIALAANPRGGAALPRAEQIAQDVSADLSGSAWSRDEPNLDRMAREAGDEPPTYAGPSWEKRLRNARVRSFLGLSMSSRAGPSSTMTPPSISMARSATSRAKPIS